MTQNPELNFREVVQRICVQQEIDSEDLESLYKKKGRDPLGGFMKSCCVPRLIDEYVSSLRTRDVRKIIA